ncbi:MAG: formylglycine-generating enzyme family protein [Planctomycetota bacterium]
MKRLVLLFTCFGLTLGCSSSSGPSGSSDSGEVAGSQNDAAQVERRDGMVLIPAGSFQMGGDAGEMGGDSNSHRTAYPIHKVTLDAYWIDEAEVTNRQFAEFVEATGYVTFAEKPLSKETIEEFKLAAAQNLQQLQHDLLHCSPDERRAIEATIERVKNAATLSESTAAGAIIFSRPAEELYSDRDITQWWRLEPKANWRTPDGPGTSWKDRLDHPVVNVTYEDALAYAKWVGKRLPTEAEWEKAARGGLKRMPFAWGDEMFPQGEDVWMANIWQGEWPYENLATDGYVTSSPVKSFPPNPYGLYDIAGNVWEIVSDYYHPRAYEMNSARRRNPTGPALVQVAQPGQRVTHRVTRGGSFLCSDVWCKGYQPGARQPFDNESPSNHTGFRCVKDVEK